VRGQAALPAHFFQVILRRRRRKLVDASPPHATSPRGGFRRRRQKAADSGEREVETRHVVACFLTHGGKVLIVRRSARVGTYRGKWSGISGYLEDEPERQALAEIREETGLAPPDVRLLRTGATVEADDHGLGRRWIVHPFLFAVADPAKVRLDWENVEARWVRADEIGGFDTVPRLKEALEQVWPPEEN